MTRRRATLPQRPAATGWPVTARPRPSVSVSTSVRIALAVFRVALLVLAAAPAARAGTYDPSGGGWDSLGYLRETAREAKVDLQVVEELNLNRLRPRDVLLWIYPPPSIPDGALERFVADGGHLIVADDVGSSDALLGRFGIKKLAANSWRPPQGAGTGLHTVKPTREHFLFFNVREVVTNAPVGFDPGDATPLLSFPAPVAPVNHPEAAPPRPALVVEARRGRGALLAVGDPSIFVDAMLRRFYGDKQFAANVMRLYCGRAPCRVSLLLPWTRVRGTYRSSGGPLGALGALIDAAAERLDHGAEQAERAAARTPWSWALALALAGLLGLAVPLTTARGRRHAVEPLGALAPPDAPPSVRELRAFTAARHEADFRDLAATLVAEVDRLGARGRLGALQGPDATRSVDQSPLGRAARARLRIQREAASLAAPGAPPMGSQRFQRLHGDVALVTRFAASATRQGSARPMTPPAARRPGSASRPAPTTPKETPPETPPETPTSTVGEGP